MIGIIDYGMGNLGSVSKACRFLELPARVITRADEAGDCSALILPGVGAFGDCMEHLQEHGFVEPIRQWVDEGRPMLGICLGLQVLFEESEESPGVPGLSILPGKVKRFPPSELKVPQIGWNQVIQNRENPLFRGIEDRTYFYFVHSYYVECADKDAIAAQTDYGLLYTSAVARAGLYAVQFHPEKSQQNGLALLKNFAALTAEGAAT